MRSLFSAETSILWISTGGILIAPFVEARPKPKRGRERDVKEENIVALYFVGEI